MNSAHTRPVLDADIDNELDAATSADIARHLGEYADCTLLRIGRDALQRAIDAFAGDSRDLQPFAARLAAAP